MSKRWLCSLLVLPLMSCQPPPPTVIGVLEGGSLVFHIRDQGLIFRRVFGWDDANWSVYGLAVETLNGRLVWEAAGARARECARRTSFPIRYGERRCGAPAPGRPEQLVPAKTYRIRYGGELPNGARGLGSNELLSYDYELTVGCFRLGKNGSVRNFRPYYGERASRAQQACYESVDDNQPEQVQSESEQD